MDDFFVRRYIIESLVKRIIYKDIPETFLIERKDLLYKVFKLICDNPGMYFNYKSISKFLSSD